MSDDVNVNMIADALNRKVDLPNNKGQDGIDYVVEWKTPTESDPTWYRVYKSGWVEQGGVLDIGGSTAPTTHVIIQLPKRMANVHYNINLSGGVGESGWQYANGSCCNGWNTTEIHLLPAYGAGMRRTWWQVSGQGA